MVYDPRNVAMKRLHLQLETGLFLVEYGFEDFKNRPSITRHRKISLHVLQFVVQGEGQYFIHNNVYDLKKNTLFYLPPNVPLKYQKDNKNPYKYFWIAFLGKNSQHILRNLDITPSDPVKQFDDSVLYNLFSQFSDVELSDYTLKGLCYSIFGYLKDASKRQKRFDSDNPHAKSEQLKKYIDTNFNNPYLTISDICQALNLSEIQLYRLSKDTFGISTKKYLIQYRMEAAETLLKQGLNVSSVTMLCGFSDVYYFSKEFKKKYGIPPSKFK